MMKIKKKTKIFVTGDTHFGDERLIQYSRKGWNFKNVEEMDDYVIKQWNSVVSDEDIVIHLGDVVGATKNPDKSWAKVKQLNGRKMLLKGNYDLDYDKNTYYANGFSGLTEKRFQVGKYIFSHEPMADVPFGMINIHAHVHVGNLQEVLDLSKRHMNMIGEKYDFKPVDITKLIKRRKIWKKN